MENAAYIAILILAVIAVINMILLIISNVKVKKYTKLYEKALAKFNSRENVQDEFNSIYTRLNEVENISNVTVDNVNKFRDKMATNVQKIGFVKYNAYDETENKLSFALALLDEKETGILINHIYSKHGSNIYAKFVDEGKVEDRISEEEAAALKLASEDRDFKKRSSLQISKTRKSAKKSK